MAGLTAAALAVIGFFAYQAAAAQEKHPTARHETRHSSPSPSRGSADHKPSPHVSAPPAGSGHGKRVVYAPQRKRVWLVGEHGKLYRTFRVRPGAVAPRPGDYRVQSRDSQVTGSDGVPVENVVRFAVTQGTTIGFSAAVERASGPAAHPTGKTGGIRERRADGKAMWLFATIGKRVVVVS